MSKIAERASARQLAVREELRHRYPHLVRGKLSPARIDRSAVVLGRDEGGAPVYLPLRARLEHAHCIGTTGAGKTKFLEHCIRQDIVDGRGVCVVDPHGNHKDSLYRSLLCWLDARGLTKSRTIHLIDPNAGSHVTGLDPLALPSPDYDFTVIAEAMQEALERVWGEEDMNAKPTMQRVLNVLLTALTELNLTLAEARLLLDPEDRHGVRAWAIANLTDDDAREELEWLHEIAREARGRQDFRMEVTGPRNRLAKLTRNTSIRTMLGQQERTLDFRSALDEGHIILANLSPGPRASDKAVQLLGRLLTRMLFFHCERRQHPERPFFFYLDECQLFLSGDVSRLLAESRKYGLGVVLSHQYQAQFELAGLDILEAVKNTTNLKVAFRMKNPAEAADLADMVLGYNLEMPVHALTKPTVVGHRLVHLNSNSHSKQSALSKMESETVGRSYTESYGWAESTAETVGEAVSSAESDAAMSAEGASNASVAGTGSGASVTNSLSLDTNLLGVATVIGLAEGESTQSHQSQAVGSNSSRGRSSSTSSSRSSSKAQTVGSSTSESVAYTTSSSRSVGSAHTKGEALTHGVQEAFEPLYEDRPGSVHSLENVRFMGAQILCNLTAGRAAISFVDGNGMRRGSLTVANVEGYTVPPAEFERLRERVFGASPSATPVAEAIENIAARRKALVEAAAKAIAPPEPASPAAYRTKKERPVKREFPRRSHGQGKPVPRSPGQGRPTAVASGD